MPPYKRYYYLNRLTQVSTVDSAHASASRKGEYFRPELPVNNSAGPVWLTLTNLAVLNDGSNPDIVAKTVEQEFLPQTPEAFSYDYDANLTQDGGWPHTWDAENHLVSMAPVNSGAGPQRLLKLEGDSLGHRIHKQVWPNPPQTLQQD